MKAMPAETEEPQEEETEGTEETEEPTDQNQGERAHRSRASGKKTVYVSPQTRAIFDTYHAQCDCGAYGKRADKTQN